MQVTLAPGEGADRQARARAKAKGWEYTQIVWREACGPAATLRHPPPIEGRILCDGCVPRQIQRRKQRAKGARRLGITMDAAQLVAVYSVLAAVTRHLRGIDGYDD